MQKGKTRLVHSSKQSRGFSKLLVCAIMREVSGGGQRPASASCRKALYRSGSPRHIRSKGMPPSAG